MAINIKSFNFGFEKIYWMWEKVRSVFSARWHYAQQSATINRIGNTRRGIKKWHFNLCFELKKIEIGEVDQKLLYFENGNK